MTNTQYFQRAEENVRNQWLSANSEPSMIYLKHNLMNNYMNAHGMRNEKMKADILTSEIAKLIVTNPDRVTELINRHSRKKIKRKPTRRELVRRTTDGLHNSRSFSESVAKEIISESGKSYSAVGSKASSSRTIMNYSQDGKGDKILGALSSTSSLVSGIGSLFGGKRKAKLEAEKAKAEAEKAKFEAEKALHEKTKALDGEKKPKIGLYIGIGVAVAAVIGTVIYLKK